MATCTAPGHSSCTITCPNGCGAMYTEPNGPCRTMCSGSAAVQIDPNERFSIQINDMPASDVERIFGGSFPSALLAKLKTSNKPVSLTLQDVSLAELSEAIEKAL